MATLSHSSSIRGFDEDETDDHSDKNNVTLALRDGTQLTLTRAAAAQSKLLENALTLANYQQQQHQNIPQQYQQQNYQKQNQQQNSDENIQTSTNEPIEVEHLEASAMKKLVSWMEEHSTRDKYEAWPVVQKPLQSTRMKDIFSEFDANFIDQLSLAELMQVLCAANYLQVDHLIELCCAKVAAMMQENRQQRFGKHSEYVK